jgi:hypothetical protein
MRHDRMRAGVEACIALLVPRVDTFEIEVAAVGFNE